MARIIDQYKKVELTKPHEVQDIFAVRTGNTPKQALENLETALTYTNIGKRPTPADARIYLYPTQQRMYEAILGANLVQKEENNLEQLFAKYKGMSAKAIAIKMGAYNGNPDKITEDQAKSLLKKIVDDINKHKQETDEELFKELIK